MNRKLVVLLFSLSLSVLISIPTHAAVDHSRYDSILNQYVEGGFFDYEAFMNDSKSRDQLDRYLKQMSTVKTDELSSDEALAYWMNLYNAATIELIEKNYPVESIKDIGGLFTDPWEMSFIKTATGKKTLDEIEHEIIRPRFEEPRIHFALVCAAQSCPPLRHEAYVGSRLDEQLNHQAKTFLDSDKNRFFRQGNRVILKLSSIFSWYGEDWGGESGVVNYVATFLSDAYQAPIQKDQYEVQYIEYDWSLNQAPGPYKNIPASRTEA